MILKVINHDFIYDMKNLCTVFFPWEKINDDGKDNIEVETKAQGNEFFVCARLFDKSISKTHILKENEDAQTEMSVLLYNVLSELTGFKPPWGILFGVRPAKLMHRFADEMGEKAARDYFINTFLATPQKTDLAIKVMHHENKIISLSSHNSFSLYVSIPFCPTRCAYCSSVSHSIEKTHKLLEPYVDLLCKELEKTGQVAKALGLRLETVYFGGGTPTTLSASQLSRLFDVIEKNFDLSTLCEYTVEAGRPDTVTEDKLMALKGAGVGRISINPQSFNDEVLDSIGRRHTSKQTLDAFALARKCGFNNINMDLIAGLPGENAEDMRDTLRQIEELSPDSLTVHSLAIKRAARMAQEQPVRDLHTEITEMVEDAAKTAEKLGLVPYYLYRQKNIAGNFENVGYAKADKAGIYNILIMEEKQTIYAAGAGATTKIVLPEKIKTENGKETNLIRIENVKNIEAYIDRIDEMIKRKSN